MIVTIDRDISTWVFQFVLLLFSPLEQLLSWSKYFCTSTLHIRNLYIILSYLMSLATFHYNSKSQFQQSNNVIWLRIEW